MFMLVTWVTIWRVNILNNLTNNKCEVLGIQAQEPWDRAMTFTHLEQMEATDFSHTSVSHPSLYLPSNNQTASQTNYSAHLL